MAQDSKIRDDITNIATGALDILGGLSRTIREDLKVRVDDWATRMDLVPREDFDRAMAMINALQQRVANLESAGKTKTGTTAGAKPASKKKAKKAA